MPTPFGHSIVAIALKPFFKLDKKLSSKILILGIICTIAPDIDVLGFHYFNIPYSDFFGHRGFTHSIFCSVVFGLLLAFFFFKAERKNPKMWMSIALYFILCTFSHVFFDMMTSGGKGCAVFSPVENGRHFLPFRPIKVAPLHFKHLITSRGFSVLLSEFLVIWLPCLLLILGSYFWKKAK